MTFSTRPNTSPRASLSPTAPTRAAYRSNPPRLRLAGALLAALTMASSCGVPFTDDGDDISADVSVAGASTAGGTKSDEATPDVAVDSAEGSDTAPAGAEDDPATTDADGDESPEDGAVAPVVAIDSRFNGRSVQYLGVEVSLGDLITTNQTAPEYLRSEDPSSADQQLLIEASITNASLGGVAMPRQVLGIRLASGERVVADQMHTLDGSSVDTARPEIQATERVVLSFPVVDLIGASFEVAEASTVPAFIPFDLDIEVAEPYVLALPPQAAVTNLSSPSLWPACDYAWTGEVVDARITLEGPDGSRVVRAFKNERWVAIQVLVTNDTTESEDFYPCNQAAMPDGNVSPRLRIDGVSTSETNNISMSPSIEMGAMKVIEFWYRIGADTEEIELTDVAGSRIALWQLALPSLPGEE